MKRLVGCADTAQGVRVTGPAPRPTMAARSCVDCAQPMEPQWVCEHCGAREPMPEVQLPASGPVDADERRLAARTPDRERLVALIESLRLRHDQCEDCWYSCPKSEEGCCDESRPTDVCTCGADAHNATIDAVLAALAASSPL